MGCSSTPQACWAALSHQVRCCIFFTAVFNCFWSSCNACQTTGPIQCASSVSCYRCDMAMQLDREWRHIPQAITRSRCILHL